MSRWVENCEMVEQTQVIRSGLVFSWEKKTTVRAFSRVPHALSPTNPTTSMQSVSAHAMLPCPMGCAKRKGRLPSRIRNRFCRSGTRLHIHHNPGAPCARLDTYALQVQMNLIGEGCRNEPDLTWKAMKLITLMVCTWGWAPSNTHGIFQ